jgi:hypothetical protein
MKDTLEKEIREGNNIVYVDSGKTPRLRIARVVKVEEKRVYVSKYPRYSWESPDRCVWLTIPDKIAIVENGP